MDNYYNLFKSDIKPSKHHSSKKSGRKSGRHDIGGIGFKILKVLLVLVIVIFVAFVLLLLFSNRLTYQSASESNIENYLNELTKNERVAGSSNEVSTAKYINDLMIDFGFESSLDGFEISPYDGTNFARNVIAIKKASVDMDNGDVLVLTTHYDSMNGTVGANDNAAGTAALIELANAIKGEKTDTTVVLAFTSATYDDYRGVRYLITNLSNLGIQKDKIIGIVDVNKIGINTTSGLKAITSDLKHTVVSEILGEYAKRIMKDDLEITYSPEGVQNIYTSNNIPAITLVSKANSMYDGLSLDTMDKLSISNIKKITDVLENTVREVMKQSTMSYLEMAKANNSYSQNVFVMTKDTVIPFLSTREVVDQAMKFTGTFAGSDITSDNLPIDLYSYKMKWFNKEYDLVTKYIYTTGVLTAIDVDLDDYLEIDEAVKVIKKYLEVSPEVKLEEGFNVYVYKDNAGRKLYTLKEHKEGYELKVTNFYTDDIIYDTEDLYIATSNNKQGNDKEQKLLSLIAKVLMPRDLKRVNKYITFTDGLGFKKGYVTVEDKLNNNSKFTFAIDLDDAFDNDNNYRNYKETLSTIIKNYAYILCLNESQVILTETPSPDMIYLFDNGVYQEGSYLKLYRDKFFKAVKKVVTTTVVKDTDTNKEVTSEVTADIVDEPVPEVLVTEVVTVNADYTGEEIIEDLAKNFVTFIIESKQSVEASKDPKVLFFYDFEELVNIREYIRNNIGL
ncbi:MAG: M28 family peptidase [archaeon]|nr:M28 family peptidase [archaeon]